MNDQVVDLTGGGYCRWTGPMKNDACVYDPHGKNSGFVLDLGYVQGDAYDQAAKCSPRRYTPDEA